ncbi:UDP-glucuronic acid decarboxylase family protein [Nitrososphaera sp.]|uniref:UDP-glucuronic acid decarboxylase family protein n=1 Tax=Nitrososphaera sp. TaxID=1971748 RepID=UPI0031814643
MIQPSIESEAKRVSGFFPDLRNKKVLVSGGAGFLGSWICDALLINNNRVTCVDSLYTGLTGNIDHNMGNTNFSFVNADVSKFECSEKFDYIIHMASRASPEEYQVHPIETLEANSSGSKTMLELARKCDCPILYTSTSEVYGDALVVPTPEEYWGNVNPNGIRSCYDEAKRYGEALFAAYHRQYGLDTRVIRIFNTYGPRIRSDGAYARALPRFCVQALQGKDITVFGDGKQTRSFCFVSDTVRGLLLALTRKQAQGEFINIGNPYEITILELAKKIKEAAKSSSNIVFRELPKDDPRRRCPVIKKAQNLLGWRPEVDLEKGLSATVEWFRQGLQKSDDD